MVRTRNLHWVLRSLLGGGLAVLGLFQIQLAFSLADHLRAVVVDRQLLAGIVFVDLAHVGLGAALGLASAVVLRPLLGWMGSTRRHTLARIALRVAALLAVVPTLAVAALLLATDGDFLRDPQPTGAHADRALRPNVVLLVADSLRRDVLDDPHRLQDLAPNLASLRGESTDYTAHESVSSWTPPSMAGLLTGRFPAELGAHGGQLDERFDTLAERLREAGYETVGVSDNYLTNPRFGFAQGHDAYWQKNDCIVFADLWFCHWRLYAYYEAFVRAFGFQYRGAEVVNAKIQEWASQREPDRPFYLMVHYMDTHYPYYVYRDEPHNVSNQRSGPRTTYYQAMLRLREGPRPPFAHAAYDVAEREDFLNRYRGSVQYLDRHVGEVIEWLKESGEWDRTLLVFTADHGEEFFEHSYLGHGRSLYQESVRVPLTIKWPAQSHIEPGVVDTPVSLLQVLPSILLAAGLDTSDPALQAPLPVRAQPGWTPVFSEFDRSGTRIVGGRFDRFKLLFTSTDKNRELLELYDLQSDPAETVNLGAEANALPDAVWVAFQSFVDRIQSGGGEDDPSRERLQDLRSLGYVQ